MKTSKDNFFKRRLIRPLLNYLQQGVTPEKLALAVALGATIPTLPVIGSTTILCITFSFLFRINLAAILLVASFAYPLQFILYLFWMKMGVWIFNAEPMPYTVSQVFDMIFDDVLNAISVMWWATMHAIVAWLCIAPVVATIIYFVLAPTFRKIAAKMQKR